MLKNVLVKDKQSSNNEYLQIEKSELAWVAAIFVYEAAGKVTAKDRSEIIFRHLQKESLEMKKRNEKDKETYPSQDCV